MKITFKTDEDEYKYIVDLVWSLNLVLGNLEDFEEDGRQERLKEIVDKLEDRMVILHKRIKFRSSI